MTESNPPVRARITTLDAVRGFAVMGILLLNIVEFAMPSYAYVDPHFYGGATGANWAVWAVNFVLFDGKMRGLFTMMFGASTVLIAERAAKSGQSLARVHYARMATLFVFGMIHAYLIWSGDILVLYSVCGAIAFVAWRWRQRVLVGVALVLLLIKLVLGLAGYAAVHRVEAQAAAPAASAQATAAWQAILFSMTQPVETIPGELKAHRGSYHDALEQRINMTRFLQTEILPDYVLDTIALMLLGMALFRAGFFSGEWSRAAYRRIALGSIAVCVPLYLPLLWWLDITRVSPATQIASDAIHLSVLRPPLALGYASLVILFLRSGAAHWLAGRLAAAGRMAFSNYLGTSILCTLLFNGYGLGWFGYLERWQLYPIVFAVWALILLWSKPWLDRFAYGPFEWLWRSVARFEFQPLQRASNANHPQI